MIVVTGASKGLGRSICERLLFKNINTLILQNINVGNNAIVSSGSVVFSKILDNSVVMGNPAKRMRILEKNN